MKKDLRGNAIVLVVTLSDLSFDIGSVNPSGISDEVYFVNKKDIESWPTIDDDFNTATSIDEYVQFKGAFNLKDGKSWSRLYNTQGKGKISYEYTGEIDCKMVVNKASISYPKITNAARAFAKYAANGDFVFCIKHDGKFYVIGNKDYRATLTPNGDSGDAAGSAKGITIDIECPDTTPLPTFTGTLVLSDGKLNCATGEFVAGTGE